MISTTDRFMPFIGQIWHLIALQVDLLEWCVLVYNIIKKRFKGIKFVIDIIEVIFCERDLGGNALRMANTSEWSLMCGLTTPVVNIFVLALVRTKSSKVLVFAVSRVGELTRFVKQTHNV